MASEPIAAAITAVVVSHYSGATLGECLRRLLAADQVGHVIVIDNGSGDDSLTIARTAAAANPRITVLARTDNPGFAVACNQGAERASTDWLAMVNPDLMVEPDTLARLQAALIVEPELGLIGAEQVDAEGRLDPAVRRRDPSLIALLASAGRADFTIARDPDRRVQRVDAISGALMLMPTELFRHIGGFDPGYRLHVEDLDLCRRVRRAGRAVAIANDVRVLHVRGVSSRRRPIWVEWHKHHGIWRYFNTFEAAQVSAPLRGLVALAVALHFLLAAVRAGWRTWRHRTADSATARAGHTR